METAEEMTADQNIDHKKHQKPEERATVGSNDTTMNELKERVKELNCFYKITKIVKDSKLSLDEALQQIVEQMPPALQYPNVTCSQISLQGGKKFQTANYENTKWALESNIVVEEEKVGSLSVNYLEEKPVAGEGPFLIEERKLLDAVSDLIGQFIFERKIREELKRQRKKLDTTEKGKTTAKGASETKTTEKKNDWEVIIDLLTKTDPRTLLRLTRKMMYYLYRIENEKIVALLSKLSPVDDDSASVELGESICQIQNRI